MTFKVSDCNDSFTATTALETRSLTSNNLEINELDNVRFNHRVCWSITENEFYQSGGIKRFYKTKLVFSGKFDTEFFIVNLNYDGGLVDNLFRTSFEISLIDD